MRSLRAAMTFGRRFISVGSLPAGMTFAPAWLLVSQNHVNVILSQKWFIEHLHTTGIIMVFTSIEIRGWCIRVTFFHVGMTLDVSEIRHFFFGNNFEFSNRRYRITSFGNIWSVRIISVRNYKHTITKRYVARKAARVDIKLTNTSIHRPLLNN